MEQVEQNEPTSFFVVPDQSVPEPGRLLDDAVYNRWNKRDEKIADIHAVLASKTKILPEQVDPQRKLLFENAITAHWVPLSNNDTRRFGAPSAQTEQSFEKAVANQLEREREVMRKQGLSDGQIASKMDEREQQARERLAKNDKAFFGIRDKPFEAQKGKSNEELLKTARSSYDEAEIKFKEKLNSLLSNVNEETNDAARTAKIKLEKARKNLVQAFTGEDDPELVKKYNEILQMSSTRQEAEKKIFEYKKPVISVASEEVTDQSDHESLPDVTEESYWSADAISRKFKTEIDRLNNFTLPKYFEGQSDFDSGEMLEQYVRVLKKEFIDQVNMKPEERQKVEQLIAQYEPLVQDIESLASNPNGKSPEAQQAFWEKFNKHYDQLQNNEKPKDITSGPLSDLEMLEESGKKLQELVEKYPDTAIRLTDSNVDDFIAQHIIDVSELQSVYANYRLNPTEEGKKKILELIDKNGGLGERYKAIPPIIGLTTTESVNPETAKKVKSFLAYKEDIQHLLNYSLEEVEEVSSSKGFKIERPQVVVDSLNKLIYTDLQFAKGQTEYPSYEAQYERLNLLSQDYLDKIHQVVESQPPEDRQKVSVPPDVYTNLTADKISTSAFSIQSFLVDKPAATTELPADYYDSTMSDLEQVKLIYENTSVSNDSHHEDVKKYIDALQGLIKVTEEGRDALLSPDTPPEEKASLAKYIQEQWKKTNAIASVVRNSYRYADNG